MIKIAFCLFLTVSSTIGSSLITTKVVKSQGYPIESHKLTTGDGYKLTLHRIPSNDADATKKPLLLIHGLLCASSMWVISPYNNKSSLAFLLADEGYDIWMMNVRGTSLSRGHKNPNISEDEYYNYSFHEIGLYDVSKTVNYVLDKTNSQNLNVVCHSQGCTSLLVLLSMKPKYNQKIASAYLSTAPVYLHHTTGMLARIVGTELEEVVYNTLRSFGIHQFQVVNSGLTNSVRLLCLTAYDFCSAMSAANIGRFINRSNQRQMLFFLMDNIIDNSAVKQFSHYLQLIRKKKFRMFDYGYDRNKRVYGKSVPPEYNLEKVTIPITIMRPINDVLSDREDLRLLMKRLSNVRDVIELPGNHIDYFYDVDTLHKLKDHILRSLL